jgi:hypothetical protein
MLMKPHTVVVFALVLLFITAAGWKIQPPECAGGFELAPLGKCFDHGVPVDCEPGPLSNTCYRSLDECETAKQKIIQTVNSGDSKRATPANAVCIGIGG